jgi:hypothetical protein
MTIASHCDFWKSAMSAGLKSFRTSGLRFSNCWRSANSRVVEPKTWSTSGAVPAIISASVFGTQSPEYAT